MLLILRSATDGNADLDDGSAGLVIFKVQRHITLRVLLGDDVILIVHFGLY